MIDATTVDGESLAMVGWWCWRCDRINDMACRSDNVPIYVPVTWAEDFRKDVIEK